MIPIQFNIQPFSEISTEQWQAVYQTPTNKNIFYHHTYLEALESMPEAFRPAFIITGRQNGELVFLQPARLLNTPLGKVFQFYHFREFSHMEPLIRHEDRTPFLEAFWAYLLDKIQPDLIIGKALSHDFYSFVREKVSEDQVTVARRFKNLCIPLPADIDEFWARYKSRFRSEFRRLIKKGEERGLTVRVMDGLTVPEGYTLKEAFQRLTELHKMRSEEIDRNSWFIRPAFQKFFMHLCDMSQGRTSLVTFTEICCDGQVVGSSMGFRMPHRFAGYATGFHPDFNNVGLGQLVVYYTIKDMIERGITTFDFLMGPDKYKKKWTEEYDPNYDVFIRLNRQLRGRLLLQKKLWDFQSDRYGRKKGTLLWAKNLMD